MKLKAGYYLSLLPGLLLLASWSAPVFPIYNEELAGDEIMREVYKRHQQFPYIYEEQSMVLEDRSGARDTRRAKRYSRIEKDGSVKFLLLFDYPEEVRGVAVLAERDPEGAIKKFLYLPALGEQLIESSGGGNEDNFLGTDFTLENLTGEILENYRYVRREDRIFEDIDYFIVDVYAAEDMEHSELIRRHFIRKDNLYITLTHHFDWHGRISRVHSRHDLMSVDGDMWRANMLLMVDRKEQHQSLIKISRRIFSRDYVPPEVFTAEWLYLNYPYVAPEMETETEIDPVAELLQMQAGGEEVVE